MQGFNPSKENWVKLNTWVKIYFYVYTDKYLFPPVIPKLSYISQVYLKYYGFEK